MDYEKKYKDALSWIKDVYPTFEGALKEDAEHFFPELKESNDKRIKEAIRYAIASSIHEDGTLINGVTESEAIAWLEKQGNIDKASYEIAEKEKSDYVSGQFIQCRKSFDEFKEYNSYWFEYVGNDTYVGRSDNILNKKFHITPRQLYCLFTQEHYYPKENNEFEKQVDKDSQVKLPTFTFDDILALQCCMETVKKVQEDKDLYEKLNDLHGRVYDAYHLEKQDKSKFEQCIQDGDEIVTNEDGTHFNISQLERVAKKEPNLVWSEDDERMRNASIRACQYMVENLENSTQDYEDAIDWLNSLKGRVQPQWKPSSEYIAALEYQVNSTCKGSWQYKASKELLEQLKKL